MAVLLRDDFVDSDGVQLDAHAISPVDPGTLSQWEYITAAAAPYEITGNTVIDAGTGVANPARLTAPVKDDLLEIFASFQRGGPQTLAQTGQLHICMMETAITAQPGRIQILIDNVNTEITLYDDAGNATRLSGSLAHGILVTTAFELVLIKAGASLESYTQDIGGGNRVLQSVMTLTGPEQALYEDGAHRMTGISCTGTQAGHYICDFVQAQDFEAIAPVGSTLLTLASGAPVLNVLAGVTPVGSTLGMLASDVPLIQIDLTPVGSSLQRVVTGIPTFTGVVQEARPSAPASADTLTLAAPPHKYNQYDESQTRRQLEGSATLLNLRIDAVERILLAQVVTEALLQQTAASDLLILTQLVPEPLDFPTTLLTQVPSRWSEPTDGTLRYTSVDFGRLGLCLVFFELEPIGNNQTYIADLLVNDVVVRSIEFQTGNAGLLFPVSVSALLELPVGTTDIRAQVTNVSSSQNVTISNFVIQCADFFSAIGFDLSSPQTDTIASVVPIATTSFLRELVNHFATLMPVGIAAFTTQNRHHISGDVGLGNLATGYARQSGSGTIVIPGVSTFVAFDPVTTLDINSSAWLQPTNAALSIVTDTERVASIDMTLVLDTNAANQMFEFRILLNGTPVGGVFSVLLQGNQPQNHTLNFIAKIDTGLTTVAFEVQNTSSNQDLDVDAYSISITDQLADG